MLLIAGFVEGFVSPTDLRYSIKFILAGGLGTLLVLYLSSGTMRHRIVPAGIPEVSAAGTAAAQS
jgi:hypothetical protein